MWIRSTKSDAAELNVKNLSTCIEVWLSSKYIEEMYTYIRDEKSFVRRALLIETID